MSFDTIKTFIPQLMEKRSEIIEGWTGYQDVRLIFNNHDIDPVYFASVFANGILDYYISIIEGINKIGDCPIMGKYLEFMSDQSVSPDELYIICTHFRKSLISFAFKNQMATEEMFEELNFIADRNIQGVIKRFYAMYQQKNESCETQKQSLIEAQKIAKVGHWELDLQENYLFWSDEVYRIFGLRPHTFPATYEAFLEHVHPEDIQIVNQAYTDSIMERRSYHLTHRIVTADGSIKYVDERCFHDFDPDGNVKRSIGTIHDVTDKVNLQKELQLSSQLFRHSNDSVVITDQQNKIVMVNDSFTTLTGYTIDEVKGYNPRLFSAGWGDSAFYKVMWDDIINRGIWQGEVVDQKKSGEYYAASLTILNVRDDEGKTTNYIGISKDITEKKAQEKLITQLAYYDTLTGLPNRSYFREELARIIKRYKREKLKFAVLFLDIDDFKWLNDSLGHKHGNQALVSITKRVQETLNGDMIFCRMGGDEFAIFAPYDELEEINKFAMRIIESVKEPIHLKGKSVSLGTSVGISLFPENGKDYGSLLQAADTALYQAKENCKNHFVFYNQTMNEQVIRRLDIDIQLRQAIANNTLSMVYQPKVSLKDKSIYGLEALVRWNDTKLGFISPDIFIPIAEESILINEIGYWVISRSLEEFAQILEAEGRDLVLSINISGKQLKEHDFVENVADIIHHSKVSPSNLEFEITETAIMDNIEEIIPKLDQIKALGVLISIDDFGTGYSSMAYLKKLPIHTIKIDRAFVKDIHSDEDDKAIIEAIVAMSKRLHLHTIAEGVETGEHETILDEIGVDNVQGYLYSKPLCKETFIRFLQTPLEVITCNEQVNVTNL